MNLGVTLKAAEKMFGPALPGPAEAEKTLSAVRYAKGGAKKYAGITGIQDNAKFYVHFPVRIDWSLLTTKKGTPDFVSDLREAGPQGEQGREALVSDFLQRHEAVQAKFREKQEAAAKKVATAHRKAELAGLRARFAVLAGEREAMITIGSESVSLPIKITVEKSGKVKITAAL
jgi:hypothetical protein